MMLLSKMHLCFVPLSFVFPSVPFWFSPDSSFTCIHSSSLTFVSSQLYPLKLSCVVIASSLYSLCPRLLPHCVCVCVCLCVRLWWLTAGHWPLPLLGKLCLCPRGLQICATPKPQLQLSAQAGAKSLLLILLLILTFTTSPPPSWTVSDQLSWVFSSLSPQRFCLFSICLSLCHVLPVTLLCNLFVRFTIHPLTAD